MISNSTTIFTSVLVFSIYVAVGESLSPAKVYVILSYFNLLIDPLRMLLFGFIMISTSKVSLNRLDHFMKAEIVDEDIVERHTGRPTGTVLVEDGEFSWES